MTRTTLALVSILALAPRPAAAFCGFYVGGADTKLFNKASQVVLVRDGNRTAISMANDYRGELTQFALVVPVPVVLKREQIAVGDRALFDRIDAYSAPRLVEYSDENPCEPRRMYEFAPAAARGGMANVEDKGRSSEKALGVTIEAKYTVGEYDILILSAKQSDGLETWLRENGYHIPKGASAALAPYIKQNLKFFVAKVNLKEQVKSGSANLRPIQFAYEDPRYMLPIRLGMINADGPQDLIVYALSRHGRVETTNYRTIKLPSDAEVPEYVAQVFPDFYKTMFAKSVADENGSAVFTEYSWDMGWCDPCASQPLSNDELRKLGVWWLDEGQSPSRGRWGGGGVPVRVTRLHVRYDAEHFPEDLMFQETADTANFQGRFVMRHPWRGAMTCAAADGYRRETRARQSREAETLAKLTGWDLNDIRAKIQWIDSSEDGGGTWYKNIFH